MIPRFSVIVATIGRDTLHRALQSLHSQPLVHGDEVLVVGDSTREVYRAIKRFGYRHIYCPPGRNFGNIEREAGMKVARGTHLVFLDDDDVYLPGAFASMRRVAANNPGRPIMFRMIDPNGLILWVDSHIRQGNHGTPQFVPPNYPTRLGKWGDRYEGDFDFCTSTLELYPPGTLVWDETVTYACRPR